VKFSEVVPFRGIVAAPKDLIITGGNGIVIVAVAVPLSTVASACAVPPIGPAVKVAVALPFG
jgi:hypothetical protein